MQVEPARVEAFTSQPHTSWDAHVAQHRMQLDTDDAADSIDLIVIVYIPRKCSFAIQKACIQDAVRQAKEEYMRTRQGHGKDPYVEYSKNHK